VADAAPLILGRIVKSHGVRGAVKVAAYVDDWAPYSKFSRYLIGHAGEPFQARAVESVQANGRTLILKIEGIDTPETARDWVGAAIAIPRADAPPPPAGTFYQYDLLGLRVEAGGRMLGTVGDILETPGHDVYVVRKGDGEWMLPATRSVIRRIDVEAGVIELDPAADLAGLAADGEDLRAEPI
jgi:16S rRNA processing protein RimM